MKLNPFDRKEEELGSIIDTEGRELTPRKLTSREKQMQNLYEKKFGRRVVLYVISNPHTETE